ncbi:hypothetical protein [Ornithinibacillus halotolerans]|uniref:Uncharacterized protein n=1 Tax=Ornithinibacillus halotolerans TaxID=1274357 RepID=A0A916S9H4_9BACI|nr:hypothetical protein [Ornithinibacillus halotolerans]GGA90384.1 hypothetical protein GCM10008025_36190 [Ornithinibacillus halotolerans]
MSLTGTLGTGSLSRPHGKIWDGFPVPKSHSSIFPVDQIKVFNGKAQAILGERSSGYPQLEVYFTNGQEFFGFESKRVVRNWIKAIDQVVLGQDPVIDRLDNLTIPGTEFITSTIKDTINTVKDVLGKTPIKVSQKCESCGAPISGLEGQVISCQYCDTNQQLKSK